MSVTVSDLAYAVSEGKWAEAQSLAAEYYGDQTPRFGMQTLEGSIPAVRHTRAHDPLTTDDSWDPRVDSGGRHSDHPDFGRDWPNVHVPALRDVAIYLCGLCVASLITTVAWLNPSWPAWTGVVAVVIAALLGIVATQPES